MASVHMHANGGYYQSRLETLELADLWASKQFTTLQEFRSYLSERTGVNYDDASYMFMVFVLADIGTW